MKNKNTRKATAVSPANIAFIKFWGKRNSRLNLPFNDSVSMNLDKCLTTTTVEFNPRFREDRVYINRKKVEGDKKIRVLKIIDIIRDKAEVSYPVKVMSENNFPSDSGIASSASAFSALALAGSSASRLELSLKQLSILSRFGSGSASRSVIDGFSIWNKGKDSNSSYATELVPPSHWDIVDIVCVVEKGEKKKSSTEGHSLATTSIFYKERQKNIRKRIREVIKAIKAKNFKKFGKILEEEAIELHVIAMTSKPAVFYWNKGTLEVINKLFEWREKGLVGYFTMDAGPNVHVICRGSDALRLRRRLSGVPEIYFTILNKPGKGTHLVKKHLF